MKIALVTNPKSGRGRAFVSAKRLVDALKMRGHDVLVCSVYDDQAQIEETIGMSDRVVVLGGDGTIHHLLPTLIKCETPLYHMGNGTANLIMKEFGMSKRPERVVADLESVYEPVGIDVPNCNGLPFLIMVSVGMDASVIHRFEEARNKRGGYRAYIRPILQEVFTPRVANVRVSTTDDALDQPIILDSGILVISNLKSYGGQLNPSPAACAYDGLLDLIAIPCATSVSAGMKLGVLRCRRSLKSMKRLRSCGFIIQTNHTPSIVQVDGEKAASVSGLSDGKLLIGGRLEVSMSHDKLIVHTQRVM